MKAGRPPRTGPRLEELFNVMTTTTSNATFNAIRQRLVSRVIETDVRVVRRGAVALDLVAIAKNSMTGNDWKG
jgi:hypothetical protein